MKKTLLSVVAWLKGEPVVTHVLGAELLAVLASLGVHLSADQTSALAVTLGAVAAGVARRKVMPIR